jgi:NADPH:quinone reductase-like Zn-dependent oxidoreductase
MTTATGTRTVDRSQARRDAATMVTIRQHELGDPGVLELTSVQRPRPCAREVLVRVSAAGVNPVDWKTRSDGGFLGEPPFTVGWDLAGVVDEVGPEVTRFAPGDRVFGMPRFPREARAYAEYATAPSLELARTPQGIEDVEAAALPLAALTAWQALIDLARVRAGERVLVHAAAGGVGHLAVQIAKERGAYVIGTARAEKHGFLTALGVDEAIDYAEEPLEKAVRDVDVVLDLVGGDEARRSLECVRDGGLLIALRSSHDVGPLRRSAGDRVRVAETFTLSEAAHAHELGEAGRTQGKLVLTMD